jgi:hypothetical protein
MNAPDYTLVITACNRADLLAVTLDSFFDHAVTVPAKVVVVEDSGSVNVNSRVMAAWFNCPVPFEWIDTGGRRNQLAAIDDAYSKVETELIFHCEEDWRFLHPGFIDISADIIAREPKVCMVGLRGTDFAHRRTERTVMVPEHVPPYTYHFLQTHWKQMWHGFSFNPGMRRLSDWRALGPYAAKVNFNPARPMLSEAAVGQVYFDNGFTASVIAGPAWVEHTGRGRHVAAARKTI